MTFSGANSVPDEPLEVEELLPEPEAELLTEMLELLEPAGPAMELLLALLPPAAPAPPPPHEARPSATTAADRRMCPS